MTPIMKIFDTMKQFIITLACMAVAFSASAQETPVAVEPVKHVAMEEEYKIIKDEVIDGIRYVVASPSPMVCSKQIDIQIQDGVLLSVVYTRGCDGNAKGIGALIKGMTVEEAIRRLEGITCGKRPTSCPDQLAKVLKSLK